MQIPPDIPPRMCSDTLTDTQHDFMAALKRKDVPAAERIAAQWPATVRDEIYDALFKKTLSLILEQPYDIQLKALESIEQQYGKRSAQYMLNELGRAYE